MIINIKKLSISIFMVIVLLIFIASAGTAKCYAATVVTIPSTSNMVAKANKLKLSKDNYSVDWVIANHKIKNGANSEKLLCVPIKSKTSSWTITNFASITFTNAGIIDGRRVDCRINFDSMTVTARKASSSGETSDGYMAFASVWGIDDGLQVGVTIEDGCGYRAKKTIKYTATVYYYDTGETVDLPFFQVVRDLDATNDYYREAWESISGYTGTYYKYSTNYCTFSGNKVLAPSSSGNTVTGNNELLKAGIYAPTTGGQFSAYFYEGNSGTLLTLYSQYSTEPKVFTTPTKSVSVTEARPDDEVEFTIAHKMGTFYKNTMSVYGNMVFTDILEESVDFVSADVFNGSGTNINSSGTWSYDENTRTVRFEMGDTWRTAVSNYNGQTISFVVRVKINDFNDELTTLNNKASIALESNLKVDTNTTATRLIKPRKLQIIKIIPGSADQIGDGHGNPTFIFKIKGDNNGRIWYRSVTFGSEEASEGWSFTRTGGKWIATSDVREYPTDTYSIEEIPVSRFKLISSERLDKGYMTVVTFNNAKDNWCLFSHKSVVINTLGGGKADVWK